MTAPKFDRDDATRHLELLFGDVPKEYADGLIEIRCIRKGGGASPSLFPIGQIGAAVTFAEEKNAQGMQAYFGAALRSPLTFPGDEPNTAAGDANFYVAPWLWLDLDDDDAAKNVAAAYRDTTKAAPPLAVTTGSVPGLRVQIWWKLVEPITAPDDLRKTIDQLAIAFGGDRKVKNPSRLMRLAGSINWPKYPDRKAELVTMKHKPERSAVHVETLQRDYPPIRGAHLPPVATKATAPLLAPRPSPAPAVPQPVAVATPADDWGAVTPAERVYTYEDCYGPISRKFCRKIAESVLTKSPPRSGWHATLVSLVAHLRVRGYEPDDIYSLARDKGWTRTEQGWTWENTEKEIRNALTAKIENWESHVEPVEWIDDDGAIIEATAAAPVIIPAPSAAPLRATPIGDIPDRLPRREWVLGERLIRKFLTVTVAPPGVGKSTLAMQEALALALNDARLSGDAVHVSGPAWVYNLEDPLDELQRRIAAMVQHWNLDRGRLRDRLFLNSARDRKLIVAEETNGVVIQTPDVEGLVDQIKGNGIVALIVDPFVRVHRVNENGNAQIDRVADMFADVADRTGCAVHLIHHARKSAPGSTGTPGDMDSARGASSLIGAARIAHTLLNMSSADADELRIAADDRRWYVRLDDAKASMSPPAESTTWFRRVSVPVPVSGGVGLDVEHVGVLERWEPSPADPADAAQEADDLRVLVLDAMVETGATTVAAIARHLSEKMGEADRTWKRRITQHVALPNAGTDHHHKGEAVRLWRTEKGRNRSDELTRQVLP